MEHSLESSLCRQHREDDLVHCDLASCGIPWLALVQSHPGTVDLVSRLRKGSRFHERVAEPAQIPQLPDHPIRRVPQVRQQLPIPVRKRGQRAYVLRLLVAAEAAGSKVQMWCGSWKGNGAPSRRR